MKIYIAGKITGDPNYKAKFNNAALRIEALGHTAINPANHPDGLTPRGYMHISFTEIDEADEVYFLPEWETSRGATLEYLYCRYTGKPIEFI